MVSQILSVGFQIAPVLTPAKPRSTTINLLISLADIAKSTK